jgi:dTDP-4-dehydrorhamnose reductase
VADVFDYDDSLITPIQLSDIDLDAPRGNDLSLDSSKAENLIGETFPKVQTGLEKMKEEVKP